MRRVISIPFGAALFAATAASSSDVSVPRPVERSGSTFHVAVCGQTIGLVARCHAHVVTDEMGHVLADRVTPSGLPAGFSPDTLRSAYGVTAMGDSNTIVAVVDAYGDTHAEYDLKVYRAKFGLPPCTTANGCFRKLNQLGLRQQYPAMDLGWARETALDLDMASAMCPNCKIYLIEANSNSFTNLIVAEATAARFHPHAISNSYGVSELGTQTLEPAYNLPGIAVTASTGDGGYGVQFPASSSHVIAVGGTRLVRTSNTRGWTETVWSGAGSGCSGVYAKPHWQTDAGCKNRTVADTAAVSDPSTGVAVFGPVTTTKSGWLIMGGTSAAAPLIAGIYGANGGPVSDASNLYNHITALWDVKTGHNGSCGGSYLCTGKIHYDGPTGLGTPHGISAY